MSPSTTNTTELPNMALLFTLPVKEQASKMTTPTKIKINPKFFNKRNYLNKKSIIKIGFSGFYDLNGCFSV